MTTFDLMCFDRFLPQEETEVQGMLASAAGGNRAFSAFVISKRWPAGSRLKVRFLDGTPSQQAFVRQYAVEWSRYANLDFDFGNHASAEIRIAFRNDGSWSYIGTDATGIPRNSPTMNFGWQSSGTVLHEFGHAIGLIHEHQNPDSNPIVWNEDEVYRTFRGSPNFWDDATIKRNIIDRYSRSIVNGTEFDPLSIMLYSFPSRLTRNGISTRENNVLSALDIAGAREAYPGRGSDGSETPSVGKLSLDAPVTGEIGTPGEEDQYTFVANSSGRYVFTTTGATDLLMSLFGPNHVKIADDDDSGGNLQPMISTTLPAGDYTVRLRHYSPNGTGQYKLTAKRSQ